MEIMLFSFTFSAQFLFPTLWKTHILYFPLSRNVFLSAILFQQILHKYQDRCYTLQHSSEGVFLFFSMPMK